MICVDVVFNRLITRVLSDQIQENARKSRGRLIVILCK